MIDAKGLINYLEEFVKSFKDRPIHLLDASKHLNKIKELAGFPNINNFVLDKTGEEK